MRKAIFRFWSCALSWDLHNRSSGFTSPVAREMKPTRKLSSPSSFTDQSSGMTWFIGWCMQRWIARTHSQEERSFLRLGRMTHFHTRYHTIMWAFLQQVWKKKCQGGFKRVWSKLKRVMCSTQAIFFNLHSEQNFTCRYLKN